MRITRLSTTSLRSGTQSAIAALKRCPRADHEFRASVSIPFGRLPNGTDLRHFIGFARVDEAGLWWARHYAERALDGRWYGGTDSLAGAVECMLPTLGDLAVFLEDHAKAKSERYAARVAAHEQMLEALKESSRCLRYYSALRGESRALDLVLSAIAAGEQHAPPAS